MKITHWLRLGRRCFGERCFGERCFGLACASGLALASSGCSFSDPFVDNDASDEPSAFIMSTMHALGQGSEGEAGYTCSDISSGGGSTSSGDLGNNLWTREATDGRGLVVEIGSLDQLLAQRYYDRDFIVSGSVDQFVVSSASGTQYEFVYWGGDECEPCPPAPYQAPQGDPFGCDMPSTAAPDVGAAP